MPIDSRAPRARQARAVVKKPNGAQVLYSIRSPLWWAGQQRVGRVALGVHPGIVSRPDGGRRWLLARIPDVVGLVSTGHLAAAARTIGSRLHQTSTSVGLRHDLTLPANVPAADIELHVRPLRSEDDLSFLDIHHLRAPRVDTVPFLIQRRLVKANLGTCYVALAPDKQICHMGWLIPASSNAALERHFGNLFPLLEPREVLFEGLFTLPAYQHLGVMTHVLWRMVEAARRQEARAAIAFVDSTNTPSLDAFRHAGFVPYAVREERWRWLRRRIGFDALPPEPEGDS